MVKFEFNVEQIKKAIRKLPAQERTRLIKDIQGEHRRRQFKEMFSQIDARVRKNPISQREINRIVDEAREEFYQKHVRNSHRY